MRIHVTRNRILGAVIAVGFTSGLAQGALAWVGEPVRTEAQAIAAGFTSSLAQSTLAWVGEPVRAEAESVAETQRRGFRPGARRGPGGIGLLPLRRLDLSDAQEEQIDQVREEAREAAAEAREPIREARRELRDALRGEDMDEGRIRELAAAVASLEADALVRRARVRADILEVLTAEQREEMRELQERRRERLEERRERFRERRGR